MLNSLKQKFLLKIPEDKRKYVTDFLSFGLGFGFSSLLALFITVTVNDGLSKDELGEFAYHKSILEILAYAFTFTVYRSYLRFNLNGVNTVLRKFVKGVIIVGIALLIISSYLLTRSVMPLLFAFFILHEERMYFFRSVMAMKRFNALKIGAAALTLAIAYGLNHYGMLSADKMLFAYGCGFVLSVFYLGKKDKPDPESDKLDRRTILKYAVPAVCAVLVKLSLDASAQLLLKSYFDFEEVSKFAIALRVLMAIKLFSAILMMFYPPVYFREIEKGNISLINKLRLGMSLCMILMAALALVFTEQLYVLMGASKYLEYVSIFRLLVISELLFTLGNFWSTYLAYAIKTHISLFIFTGGAILNISILVLFLEPYGVQVAAIAVLATNAAMLTAQFLTAYRWERKFIKQKYGKPGI